MGVSVSVIIPTYNYGHYISNAINSILQQEYFDGTIEIIVIDDGSQDDTSEKVKLFGNKVKYIYQKNQGKATATRMGISEAKGKYIFNLDADDLYLPTRIAEAVAIYEKYPEVVHVAHPAIYRYSDGRKDDTESIDGSFLGKVIPGKYLLQKFYINSTLFGGGSTFSIRSNVAKTLALPQGVDMYTDEYLVMFALLAGASFFIDHPLSVANIHGENFSSLPHTPQSEKKLARLLDSSKFMNDEIQNSTFEKNIKQIYKLSHKIRELHFLEFQNRKKPGNIVEMWRVFLSCSHPFSTDFYKILRNYNVVNRTIPTRWLRTLKKIRG
jgi:glycosyltransferase involved in cell wall biosynthesis